MRRRYTLLGVSPTSDETSVSVDKLDNLLRSMNARILRGITMGRKFLGQAVVRLDGAADERAVRARLDQLGYDVVDREDRKDPWIPLLILP